MGTASDTDECLDMDNGFDMMIKTSRMVIGGNNN